MNIDKYTCEGQMSLFDLLQPEGDNPNYWDPEINEMAEKFVSWAQKQGFDEISHEFSVWPHVPQLGFRLALRAFIPKTQEAWDACEEFVESIHSKGIEVHLMITPTWYKNYNPTHYSLWITTCYKDGRKDKRNG